MAEINFEKYNTIDYSKTPKILEVKNLKVSFKSDEGVVHAIRGVSFDLYKGETLCIVGESGCGKSTVCKTLMGILSNEAIVEGGNAVFKGEDLTKISEEEFHRIRGDKIGMIFQDPLSSLNPIMKVGKQIVEATMINRDILKKRYDSLISKELVACKNNETNYRLEKHKLTLQPDFYYSDSKKKLNDEIYDMRKRGVNSKEIEEYKNKSLKEIDKNYKALKKENKLKIKEKKKEYKKQKPLLSKALAKKKKEAKKENKEYAKTIKAKYSSDIKVIDKKIKAESNQESLLRLKAEKKKIQDEYTSKTKITKKQAKEMALNVMREVGINNPEVRFNQYPFEFSGGMRQRIVIAIALTANPEVLICDEPTTALDVTIQAQILELINKIKDERKMSVIFITHDLGVVANMADRIAVMYAGKIVEVGTTYEVFYEPKHPYTWALLSSIPDMNSKEKLIAIPGTPPNLVNPPKGDAFADRNQFALDIDFECEPPLFQLSSTHFASTWLLYKDAPNIVPPRIVTNRIKNSIEREMEKEYEQSNKQ